MEIKSFEEFDAWKTVRRLAADLYHIKPAGGPGRDDLLADIRQGTVTVLTKIAAGFDRRGDARELSQFLSIAKGTLGEVKARLHVARDTGIIDHSQFEELYSLAGEAGEQLDRHLDGLQPKQAHAHG